MQVADEVNLQRETCNLELFDRKQEITDLVVAHLRTKLPAFSVSFDTEAILVLKRV